MRPFPLLLLVLAIAASSPAQEVPLGGPSVDPAATAPTLIERDDEGGLVPLDCRPAFAAIELLGLNDDEIEAAHDVVERREALVDGLVVFNLPLLREIDAAYEDAPPGARLQEIAPGLAERFRLAFADLWTGSHLVYEVKRRLPGPVQNLYGQLVSDWLIAAMDQARDDGPADGLWPFEIVMRHIVWWEIEASIRRVSDVAVPQG